MNRILRLLLLITMLSMPYTAAFADSIGSTRQSATCPRPTGILHGAIADFYLEELAAGGAMYNQSVFFAFNDSTSTETLRLLPNRTTSVGPGQLASMKVTRFEEVLDAEQKPIGWNSYINNSAALYAMLSRSVQRSFLFTTPPCTVTRNLSRLISKPLPIHDPQAVFPEDANQLSALTGIFLDGEDANGLSEKQIGALDLWIANGGILFLDPLALKTLKGRPFLRGANVANGDQPQVDLARWRKTIESLVSWAPPTKPTSTPYGYAGYGGYAGYAGYGAPAKTAQQTGKPTAASAPTSRPISPTAFASISALKIPADSTLQIIGEPPVLAAWRYGEGIVSVQAFEGVGDETLMKNWVALQLTRLYSPRKILATLTGLDVREDLLGMAPASGGFINQLAQPLQMTSRFPKIRRQWMILLALPAGLLLLNLLVRFSHRLRWRHGLIALALLGTIVWTTALAFPFGEELLTGRSEVLAPLPTTMFEGRAVNLAFLRIGSTGPPANEVRLGKYPLWSFHTYGGTPNNTVVAFSDEKLHPFVSSRTAPARAFSSDFLGLMKLASMQYAEEHSSGQVRLVIEKDTTTDFRGTLINETTFDLGGAYAVLRVKGGWMIMNCAKQFAPASQHQFSLVRGTNGAKQDIATNCEFIRSNTTISSVKARSPFERSQSAWRAFTPGYLPEQPCTGFVAADLTQSLADSPAVTVQEKSANEYKRKYLIQLLAFDGLEKVKPAPPTSTASSTALDQDREE